MTRNFKIAAAIVVVAILALVWHLARTDQPVVTSSAASGSNSGDEFHVPSRAQPKPLHVAGVSERDPELGTGGLDRDDPVTAYRKANVYPPGSRPLTKDHLDLLKPGQRYEGWKPVDADDGTTYLFTADRFFAFGNDVITATLQTKSPKPVTITQGLAGTTDPAFKPVTMSYTQINGVWTAQLSPAALKLVKQTEIGLYIEFDDGTAKQRSHINVQYTPDAGVPARFTGTFADSIVAGSLDVRVGMQVIDPGHYVLDCNLYDAGDNPVAWVHWKGDLGAGAQNADLSFFGKVIVDAGAKGPFHIGQLRGARFDPGAQPDLAQVPPFDGTYTTSAYPTTDFSGDEYDSPDKQNMLKFLSEQQAKGVHQAGAGTPGGPAPQPGDDH